MERLSLSARISTTCMKLRRVVKNYGNRKRQCIFVHNMHLKHCRNYASQRSLFMSVGQRGKVVSAFIMFFLCMRQIWYLLLDYHLLSLGKRRGTYFVVFRAPWHSSQRVGFVIQRFEFDPNHCSCCNCVRKTIYLHFLSPLVCKMGTRK